MTYSNLLVLVVCNMYSIFFLFLGIFQRSILINFKFSIKIQKSQHKILEN